MNTKSIKCPGCGQPATGNFCSHCGIAIGSICPSCGADIKPGSRACHACGAPLTARVAGPQWNAQTVAPWAAIGIATVALVVAVTTLIDGRSNREAAPLSATEFPFSAVLQTPSPPVVPVDMTARQAADQLFNRIMSASENGEIEEALRFVPMAVQAYDSLVTMDNDAHYHVALIYMTAGDIKSTRVHLKMLRRTVPTHLLGFLLEHQIALKNGDQAAAGHAYKAFLDAYDTEIVAGRSGYQDHRGGIERFHKAALAWQASNS